MKVGKKMLFFVGLIIGFLVLLLPPRYWTRELPRLPADSFYDEHPQKRLAYFILHNLPFVRLLLYVVGIIPLISTLPGTGQISVYFAGYLLGAGLSIGDGLVEFLTRVAIIRSVNFSRTFSLRSYLVHDPEVKILGLSRIAVVSLVGLFSWFFLTMLYSPALVLLLSAVEVSVCLAASSELL